MRPAIPPSSPSPSSPGESQGQDSPTGDPSADPAVDPPTDPSVDPTAESAAVDRVFTALADPTRRRLLRILASRRPMSASALAGQMPVTRQAIMQHLAVLQQSQLVAGRRVGREVLYSVQPGALLATADWMTTLADTWTDRLHLLKDLAESGEPETE